MSETEVPVRICVGNHEVEAGTLALALPTTEPELRRTLAGFLRGVADVLDQPPSGEETTADASP